MIDERTPIEDMKDAFEKLREEDGEPVKVYMLQDAYDRLSPEMIADREAAYHCKIVPVDEHEMNRIKDDAVPYTIPPELPDSAMLQPAMYDVPHIKGGRYHEPPRDLKKKKKAKRRAEKQARRKRR